MAKKTDIKTQAQKEFPDFVDAVDRLSVTELDSRLLAYAKEVENTRTSLEENATINKLKEDLKQAKGPFNDTQKALRVKMKYLMSLIAEKGGIV